MNDQLLPHPMSLKKLLRGKARITASPRLADLPRLSHLELPPDTQITVSFKFDSEPQSKQALIKLTIIGQLPLKCQRCMEFMSWELAHTNELIATTEIQTDSTSSAYELVLCEDGYVDFTRLIEDELLLTIPQIPIHSNIEDCHLRIRKYMNTSKANEQNPFSVLKQLVRK